MYGEDKEYLNEVTNNIIKGMKKDKTIYDAVFGCIQCYSRIKHSLFALEYSQTIDVQEQSDLYDRIENNYKIIRSKAIYASSKYKELEGTPLINFRIPWDKRDLRNTLKDKIFPILDALIEKAQADSIF